jgi:nucleoside-diphosphate-sugar epimerase
MLDGRVPKKAEPAKRVGRFRHVAPWMPTFTVARFRAGMPIFLAQRGRAYDGMRKQALFDQINVEGTRVLVNAATSTASVRRVVAVSAAAVIMGDAKPMLDADESLPLQVRTFSPYGSSKAEDERVLLAANGVRPGFETIALRPPFILGGRNADPRPHGRDRERRPVAMGRRMARRPCRAAMSTTCATR